MGQQQLLLLVIGTIIVGIAIFIAINLATIYYRDSNRDGLIHDIHSIASFAKEHYHRPAALGGGSYSYNNFTIPSSLANTPNGSFMNMSTDPRSLLIIGIGKEIGNDGVNKVKVSATITPDSINVVIIN